MPEVTLQEQIECVRFALSLLRARYKSTTTVSQERGAALRLRQMEAVLTTLQRLDRVITELLLEKVR